VAITEDAQLVGEYRLNINNVHSERLVGAIEKLVLDANLQPRDIDGIAVSIGPGSFTGLRIGLSVAKGMAFSLDIPLTIVPTLEALAWQAPIENGDICAVLRARANLVYAGCYSKNGDSVKADRDVQVVSAEELEKHAKRESYFIGEGTKIIEGVMQKLAARSFPARYSLLSGLTIAILGTEKLKRGEAEELHSLAPLYVQDFIASKPKSK